MRGWWLIIVFATLCGHELAAQSFDALIKKDGSTLQGKVLRITAEEIEFDPKGTVPFVIVKRGDAESILYADGTLVKFETPPAPVHGPREVSFLDKRGYRLKDIILFDGTFNCSSLYKDSYGGTVASEEFFSSDEPGVPYKLQLTIKWLATTESKMFAKGGPKIFFQSINYSFSVLKNGEVVYTRDFSEPNFSIEIARAFIQGSEKTVGRTQVYEYMSDRNVFSYAGQHFTCILKFYDGIFIWEPNTRIGSAYQTFKVHIKAELEG